MTIEVHGDFRRLLNSGIAAMNGGHSPIGEFVADPPDPHTKLYSPPADVLVQRMESSIEAGLHNLDLGDRKNWLYFSWTNKPVKVRYLLEIAIPFSDDLRDRGVRPRLELYPVSEAGEYVNRVIEESRRINRPLGVDEQFGIALDLAGGYPVAASVVAMLGSRAVSRRKDDGLGEELRFPLDTVLAWNNSVCRFDTSNEDPDPGNLYHYFSAQAVGMAAVARGHLSSAIGSLLIKNGAFITRVGRGIVSGKPHGRYHDGVNKLGFEVGYRVVEECLNRKKDLRL